MELLESFGIFGSLGYKQLMQPHAQAHTNSHKLMQAQMLRMCLGDAQAMLKLELLVAIRSLERFL